MGKRLSKRVLTAIAVCALSVPYLLGVPQAHAAGEEFQLGVFYMPTQGATNATQYDYMKDASINFIQSFYPNDYQMSTIAQMNTVLNLAAARGMKVQVSDTRSENLMTTATDADIDAIANTYKNHPATGGYYIKDEPGDSSFPRAAYVYNRFLLADPDSNPNVNMLPGGVEHYNNWVRTVGAGNLKWLTMDYYPFGSGGFNSDFYLYMDLFRSSGISNNVKTAVYLQSVGLKNSLSRPTADQLRWHVYNSLAYGVKGLYWFTWFQPLIPATNTDFTTAIFDGVGNKTDLYNPAKTLGSEIKQLGPTLMKLTPRDIYYKGPAYPGTTPIPANYFWQPTTSNAQIVSHFLDANSRSYIMVVNQDYANSKTLSFNLPSKPASVTEISKTNGTEIGTNYSNATGNISAAFLPGEGKLYAISTDFAVPPLTVDDKDLSITYSGSSWYRSDRRGVGDYGDDLHVATANNDSFEMTFTGTGIDFQTEKDPSGGNIDIYIDNVFQQTVSAYGTISNQPQQTVYSKTGLSNGPHTIKGVKKSGTYMVVDTFKIAPGNVVRAASKTNDTYSGIAYSGTGWGYSNSRGVGNYLNDLHYTTVNNDYFQYTFTGTGIDFISETDPGGGDVDIYIDNVLQGTISTIGALQNHSQQTVFSKMGLPYGQHTIKAVKKSGTYMVLDGFNEYSGSNLIANPGFESGATSWGTSHGGTLTTGAAYARTGTTGAKMTNRTYLYSSPTQDVTSVLTAGGRGYYNLSGWSKLAAGTSDRVQVAIRLVDSAGTHWVNTDFKKVTNTEWTQNSKICNITWEGKLVSATLYAQTETYGFDMYFDDFVLSR
ncbi:hypothetical protein [Cohnella soli]|uniref:Uncharacterized protein n=1 Tax=Cohnella soli TaxID=425005 RepID=A0ABW0HPN3_9BACL